MEVCLPTPHASWPRRSHVVLINTKVRILDDSLQTHIRKFTEELTSFIEKLHHGLFYPILDKLHHLFIYLFFSRPA